jgi:hypothetical protein
MYGNYITLVRSTASLLDQRQLSKARNIPSTPKILANHHEMEETEEESESYDDNYEINKHSIYESDASVFNIDTDMNDLEVHRARQKYAAYRSFRTNNTKQANSSTRVSLDRATWHNLSNEDKAKWDTLTPGGKSVIISGTRQRGAEVSQDRNPVQPKVRFGFGNTPSSD